MGTRSGRAFSVFDTMDNETQTDNLDCPVLLQIVCEKLSIICDDIKVLKSTVGNIDSVLVDHTRILSNTLPREDINVNIAKVGEHLTSQIAKVETQLSNLTSGATHPIQDNEQVNTSQNKWVEEEAYKKRQATPEWQKKLKMRKDAYWKSLKSHNKAKIYENWLGLEEPFIPKKFSPKLSENEPEELKVIKHELAIQKVEAEMKILNSMSKKHEETYKAIDLEMEQIFSQVKPNSVCEKLKVIWTEEISTEEKKSENFWEKKKEYFRGLLNSDDDDIENNRIPKERKSRAELPTTEHSRDTRPRRINRTSIDFNTFEQKGPKTINSQHVYKTQNRKFNNNNNNRDFRPSRRFLGQRVNTQNPCG